MLIRPQAGDPQMSAEIHTFLISHAIAEWPNAWIAAATIVEKTQLSTTTKSWGLN